MSDILTKLGVSSDELKDETLDEPVVRDIVKARCLHIDADFLAYQVTADESTPYSEMQHNLDVRVETLRLMAGAEKTVLHLTAEDSTKGNRYVIAIQREYQAQRKDREKPEALHDIKNWMTSDRGAMNHTNQEADDGLCQALVADPVNNILVSMDKDLWMCVGTHMDWHTGELETVDGFGYVKLCREGSSPKMKGKGTKYFWTQMLTGDPADNIQGLPKVSGKVMNKFKPTKAIKDAYKLLDNPKATTDAVLKAQGIIDGRKPGGCGPVMVELLMDSVNNDVEAFNLVRSMYKEYGKIIGFTHWETGVDVPWQYVFLSEANLLWMRREPGINDVQKFLRDLQHG